PPSAVTGLSRVEIYTNFERPLSPEELSRMHVAVERRGKGEPLQYVTGEMPFRHIILRCEEGVLIPRPETEVLVDAALEGVDAALTAGVAYDDVQVRAAASEGERRAAQEARVAELQAAIRSSEDELPDERKIDELMRAVAELDAMRSSTPAGVRVLDLCTGTGCIALSMAGERPGTHVVATDLSQKAVSVALANRDRLGLADAVDVYECDLAAAVPAELMGTFSVIVSNPPYIPSAVVPTLPAEVAGYEPHLALDGGVDGLDLFRRILDLAPQALAPKGWLCVELFEENVHAAANLCRRQGGWVRVEVREDLTHRPRVLVAVREA
ncbi:MAG: peptide chain release factor N(5)-glutamine methyltransferase, partial [Atopobiaceae bacterium]|nr:peptide chain release factor N(5)-glutamine methyltransferase [Atopobiaceae bacterium]